MKKTISSLTAFSLLATNIPLTAYASPVEDTSTSQRVGNLEVDINFALPIANRSEGLAGMTLTLMDANNRDYPIQLSEGSKSIQVNGKSVNYEIKKLDKVKRELPADSQNVYYYSVVFKDLPEGEYSLALSGEGFKTAEVPNIQLKDYSQRVTLSNNESFLIGDFNKDGQVTKADYDELLANIKSGNSKYDLNHDGVVSILDLSYVHENLNKTASGAKIVDTSPILDATKLVIDTESTKGVDPDIVETIVEKLLTGEESVALGITEEQPAQIGMSFNEVVKMDRIDIAIPNSSAAPSAGYVLVENEQGEVTQVNFGEQVTRNAKGYSAKINRSTDTIQINLNGQVAVKKITIVVTGTTAQEGNLAEIGKVEFLNNVYEEIPAPHMNIPTITEVEEGSEEITIKWNAEPNVEGYEIKAVGTSGVKTLQTTKTTATIKDLTNFEEYKISIQSLNGDWTSGYSKEVSATPKPTDKPSAPEGISITGGYQSLVVKWKKNKEAIRYNLYYRVSSSQDEFEVIKDITGLSYTIPNLQSDTEYEVYMTAVNEHGVSGNSNVYKGKTIDLVAAITPNYKLINTSNGVNQPTSHILDVSYPNGTVEDKFDIVDSDDRSSWIYKNWESGGFNDTNGGPIITFDEPQTFDRIVFTADVSQKYSYGYHRVKVWENGNRVQKASNMTIKTDSNGKQYYEIKLDEPVTTDKVQVSLSLSLAYGDGTISISEMKFYQYDSLEDDVRALFKDDLLVELKETTDLTKINKLRERANTRDTVSGEYHPDKDVILSELAYAEKLYEDSQAGSNIMVVNQGITNSGNNIGMANDLQALGLSVRAGDEIVVYVGSNGVVPELVFTQHYGESGRYQTTKKLQKGRNVIQVPKIHNLDVEKGGSVYVRYPSSTSTNGDVKVRVIGATKIPHLNLYGKINDKSKQDEVKADIRKYITDLQAYVDQLPKMYPKEANTSENKYVYDKKTSVMNTTDIELDKATLNVSATAIWEGLQDSASMDDKVDQLYDSLKAMEQIMDLKYAERGVSENPDFDKNGKIEGDELKHVYPKSRANIKYQRMFTGAFMYASSNHIGIEYDSIPGLTKGKLFTFNDDGTVKDSGKLFGWGIAHEIGHMTDLPKIGTAEVTNNIIALLAQTLDDKSESRLESSGKYEDIYEKVTSGTVGTPSDVFVHLGMYWQLHLAYDKNPTALMLKTDTDSDPTNDSFYAKMSKRLRTLTTEENSLSKEQLLIRVASDAAGKDLSNFFAAWGIVADDTTKAYLSKKGYQKETRSIQYLNDSARRAVLNDNVSAKSDDTAVTADFAQGLVNNSVVKSKDITLNLGVNKDSNKILGYEISRNGKVVGFTTEDTFTDSLGSINNRVVEYSVKAIDYHLNETEVLELQPIKVSHDGTMDKRGWSVETNMTTNEDQNDEDTPHGPVLNPAINKVIDSDVNSEFTGTKPSNEDGYVILDMNTSQPIVGFKYTKPTDNKNAIKNYEVYVSNDKENWTLANKGTFDTSKSTETIYFNKEGSEGGKQLWSYNASYVKIVAKGSKTVSISELDVIAPPGDNIEIGSIGTLKTDFVYGSEPNQKIPQGSFIVTGEYRGHPAYNASLLRDQNGNILSTETIFMAKLPSGAELGEISSGTYITWITPEQLEKMELPSAIMKEMYRVNDAETLEGQRLVSDTLYSNVPETLPEIEFSNSSTNQLIKKASINKVSIYQDFKKVN